VNSGAADSPPPHANRGGGDAAPADSGAAASVLPAGRPARTRLVVALGVDLCVLDYRSPCTQNEPHYLLNRWVNKDNCLSSHGESWDQVLPKRVGTTFHTCYLMPHCIFSQGLGHFFRHRPVSLAGGIHKFYSNYKETEPGFLGILLRVLRHEISVYNVYITK